MKKFLVFASAILLIMYVMYVLVILPSKRPETGATVSKEIPVIRPQIQVTEPVFHFGSVYEGEEVTHTFKIKSVGNDTLRISKVDAPCGCSKVKIFTKEIPHGEFGEIEATFRTKGYRGQQSKTIFVHSNDPLKPITQLQLKGNVKVEVEVKPSTLSFNNVQKNKAVTKEFEIIQMGETELMLGKLTTNIKYLKIDLVEKKRKDKGSFLVRATLKSDAPVGNISGMIEVSTNLERQKTIKVPVWGKIVGKIKLSPEWIRFRVPAGGKEIFPIFISTRGSNFKILRIENKVKYLSAEIVTLEKMKKYRIDFSVDPEAPPGQIRGNVKVYTNDSDESELTIPVFGWVTQKKIDIAYFSERGCLECDRLRHDLQSLKAECQTITIKEFNIELRENKKLNEALCEIYHVPEEERMITPAVFIGKDFICGKLATKEKLIELINKYKDGASLPWQTVRQMTESADQGIIKRFRSLGALTVMGAGMIDGVNPCAFATIIFFISYLAIAKRKRKELIIIGLIFTSSVFITYFLIGIGIFEFLNSLSFFSNLTRFIYGIMGILTLILGFFSLADYSRCRRGNPREIRLQLPVFLKRKIHSTIRKGAGLRRYVLAAFIIGFLVSVLELSCTGQVYLPTIVYATGISQLRLSAYTYLSLYNLMFIVPLLVVFVLVYFGTTSIRLGNVLSKNIALIKLLTSILFFIFTIFLITMFII